MATEKKLLLSFILIVLNLGLICTDKAPIIISLGIDCEPATVLHNFALRNNAYPFDQLVTQFSSLYSLLENDFDCFLQKNNLIYASHPFNARFGDPEAKYVIETKYDIIFRHHFEFSDKFLDSYGAVKKLFNRRIARFYDHIHSDKYIYFLRKHMTKEQAQLLVNLIDRKFPNLRYKLIVVNFLSDSNESWGINKVNNFYISSFGIVDEWWKWPQRFAEWQAIFKQLGVLKKNNLMTDG